MSSDVKHVSPQTAVTRAAAIMRVSNIGCLPVVERGNLVGVVTDRDIVVRAIGEAKDPARTSIGEIMSRGAHRLNQRDGVSEALSVMRDRRVRRLPVVDDHEALVGIVTLTDIALRAHEPIQSGTALACICAQPALVS